MRMSHTKLTHIYRVATVALFVVAFAVLPVAADTGWLQTAGGSYSFTDTANWQDGVVSGLFGDNLTSKITLTLAFDEDWTFGEGGLSFSHPGEVSFQLIGDGNDRKVTFAGDQTWTPATTKGSLAFGSGDADKRLVLDLGGEERTFDSSFPVYFNNPVANGDLVLTGTAGVFGFSNDARLDPDATLTVRKAPGDTQQPTLRIGDESNADAGRRVAGTLRLEAGTVNFYARKYGSGAEDSVGTLVLASSAKTEPTYHQGGYPILYFRSSNQKLTFRAGAVEREDGAMMDITGNNLGLLGNATAGNALKFLVNEGIETVGGKTGTTSCAVVPWARIAETGFAVYDSENGFRALNNDTERRTISEAFEGELDTDGENIYIAPGLSKVEFTGTRTVVNSLSTGYATVAQEVVATNGTLEVTSGAIMLDSNQRVYLRANVDFGSRRGYFTNRPGKYSEFYGSMAGSDGVTFGSIALGGKPSVYNNQGSLTIYATGTFTGDVTILGNIWLQSGTFLPHGERTGDTIIHGYLRLGNMNMTMNGLRGRGTIVMNNNYTSTLFVGDNDSDADFEGNIYRSNGTIALRKIGTGTQRIGGTISINGAVSADAGTLMLDGPVSCSAVSVASGAAIGGSGSIATTLTFADGAKLSIAVTDDEASCLTVTGAVTGGPVTVDANVKSGKWKTTQCVLKSDAEITATFVRGGGIGALELRNNGTELWVTPKTSGLIIFIR